MSSLQPLNVRTVETKEDLKKAKETIVLSSFCETTTIKKDFSLTKKSASVLVERADRADLDYMMTVKLDIK